MKAADRSGAKVALILGDTELAADEVVVKDLVTGDQQTVPLETAVATVLASLAEQAGSAEQAASARVTPNGRPGLSQQEEQK